ncbi:MAG: hypothetical protein LAO55_23185 [Acidobacteriia bacterium]|nr:hypothetical protein [Terriglobia bacterium]
MRETEGTSLYSHLLRPVLFRCDPEFAHDLTLQTLHYLGPALALIAPFVNLADPLLETECLGLRFHNPIGLAAGLDKDGKAIHAWKHLGFGFAEVGTITPRAQPGNPRPRLFRLRTHQAIINRMGFNNEGSESLKRQLQGQQRSATAVLRAEEGVNLPKRQSCVRCQPNTLDSTRTREMLLRYSAGLASPCPTVRFLAQSRTVHHLPKTALRHLFP